MPVAYAGVEFALEIRIFLVEVFVKSFNQLVCLFGGDVSCIEVIHLIGLAEYCIASEYYVLWCCRNAFGAGFKRSTACVVVCRIESENAHVCNVRARSVFVGNVVCKSSVTCFCHLIDVWSVCSHQRSFSVQFVNRIVACPVGDKNYVFHVIS